MKKYLFILFSSLLVLSACGTSEDEEVKSDAENNEMNIKVHENIGDEIAEESYEVMSIIEKAVDEGTEVNHEKLNDYLDKYDELWYHEDESLKLTEEEAELFKMTNVLIELLDYFMEGEMDFQKYKELFIEEMEHGE